MAASAPLELYIRRAFTGLNPDERIFQPSDYMPPPTLVKHSVNYILTFKGCFNPPHEGHKSVLCHGFFRGGEGIRLVAGMVLPVNDSSVVSK